MAHANLLDINTTALIVVDIQEAFRNAIPTFPIVASRASIAVRGFSTLGVPVIVTEQYPKGLGPTAPELAGKLGTVPAKTAFSCGECGELFEGLEKKGIHRVLVCGIEAHVCVNQTAHDLLTRGFQVHLLTDCVCSRFEHDQAAGLAKMKASGVLPSSIEMAFFELMRDSKHPKFREVQELIR